MPPEMPPETPLEAPSPTGGAKDAPGGATARLFAVFIENRLLVNLGLLFVLILGLLCWRATPQEMFPVVQLDTASISTVFEGAAPREVEEQVTAVIEEEFENSRDIDYISSVSIEGVSNIYLKLKSDGDMDDFLEEARTLLDGLAGDLPEGAEEPRLSRIRTHFPVISLTLYGGLSKERLHDIAEQVRLRIQGLPGVANVGLAGEQERELRVTVDPHRLSALGIRLGEIVAALRNNLQDLPGGTIKAEEGGIRLRGRGESSDPRVLERLVLRATDDGGQLLLGEVAQIELRFEEATTYARFNGQPSINMTVTKSADASTIEVSRQIRELVRELRPELPPSAQLGVHTDMSKYVKTRLNTVKSSGLIGLTLLLLALCLLLDPRVALITAFGIPFSFLFAVILLHYLGYTINMISLFAFLVVLGMIVDDAIIVTENAYRHVEAGLPPHQAALRGAREVAAPVAVATLTTISAFLPMTTIGGTLGLFIQAIPVIVAGALLGSMLESFIVLPGHAALLLRARKRPRRWSGWRRLRDGYGRLLSWATGRRYLVLAMTASLLAASLSYAATRIPYQLFGHVELGQFFINIEAPNTYSLEQSEQLARRVEAAIFEVITEDELDTLYTNIGISFTDFQRFSKGSNLLQLVVDLKSPAPRGFIERWVSPLVSLDFSGHSGKRRRGVDAIGDAVRQRLSQIPGIRRLRIVRQDAGPPGNDIELGIVSRDPARLRALSDEVQDFLRRLPGVRDVQHDQEAGKAEFHYTLNEKGRRLGLTQEALSEAVHIGYLGRKVTHVTLEGKRIPVRLMYSERLRREADSLARLPIILPSDRTAYLGDVAEIRAARGPNHLRHRDGLRMARLSADVNTEFITALEASALIQERFAPAGAETDYKLLFLGEKKRARESFAGIFQALFITLALISFLLTALFRSLLDPLAVLLTIPLGFVGVIAGHALFGYNLQFLSVIGMLALSGIIINDSLILVDFSRRLRAGGMPLREAMIRAGLMRARPILLTTITTFLGLSPLIFFATGQTAFLAPMAVSLGFGLLFATPLILIVLPCLCLAAEDLRLLARRTVRRAAARDAPHRIAGSPAPPEPPPSN